MNTYTVVKGGNFFEVQACDSDMAVHAADIRARSNNLPSGKAKLYLCLDHMSQYLGEFDLEGALVSG